MRRYVRRQARTIVLDHRQSLRAEPPWQRLGISESYYYKWLRGLRIPKDARGRFVVDQPLLGILERAVGRRDDAKERRAAVLELLRHRGFSDAAARKWLQRHDLDDVRTAQPRRPK
jgi:hypothetical protein